MSASYRKKPFAQLEHGTRIYAPSPREERYRVVASDPVSRERIFVKCRADGSDALVQDVGAVMRALVTHARRLRWLTAQSEDPMWMVRYAKESAVQGASAA